MDAIGSLGEITIRTIYMIFSASVLIQSLQAYVDYGSWIRSYYLRGQFPDILSYLYWMLLGAWQASRRRMNEPWSTLNIIQPKHPGPAFQPYEYDGNELASSGNLADETRRFH
ncbi:unnamed protein product [Discula destructiva]